MTSPSMSEEGSTSGLLPGGRTLSGVTFVHSAVEYAAWITILVVAFERGGAAATGMVVAIQLIPAAILAPVVAAAGDRFPGRSRASSSTTRAPPPS